MGCARRRSREAALGDGRIDHALSTEVLQEPACDLERTAVDADVLAEYEHGVVAGHLLEERFADGLEEGHGFPVAGLREVLGYRLLGHNHLSIRPRWCGDRPTSDGRTGRSRCTRRGSARTPQAWLLRKRARRRRHTP